MGFCGGSVVHGGAVCERTLPYSGHEPEYQSVLGWFSNLQLLSPSGATVPRGMNA